MALKKCRECGEQVSSKADKCPNCGIKNPTTGPIKKFLRTLGGIAVFILILVLIFNDNDPNADAFSKISLNVRQGPSTEHKVKTALEPGERVRFLDDSLGWKRIVLVERDGYKTGWASGKYLSDMSEYSSFNNDQNSSNEKPDVTTREEKIKSQFSSWDGSHRNLTDYIQENMHDPDSYEHVETVYWDQGDHLVVRTTFRGNNAFGAKVKNYVKAKVSLNGQVLEILSE